MRVIDGMTIPVASVLLSNQLLHEPVTFNLVIALVVVLGSVWLGLRERRAG